MVSGFIIGPMEREVKGGHMSKVIVTGIKDLPKGQDAKADIQIFCVDMTPLEVKELLQNHEQNIADIKMARFRKSGDTARLDCS